MTQKGVVSNDLTTPFVFLLRNFADKSNNNITIHNQKMKKLICILFAVMSLMPVAAKKQPAVVKLTAGQSNTDGQRIISLY